MKELDPRRKKYCRERIKGKTQSEAYYAAGYSKRNSKKTAMEAACKLERLPEIKAEMERLSRQVEAGAILSREQRLAILSDMAVDESRKDDSRQRAIDMLNRMQGDYTDRTVTEIKGGLDLSLDDKRQMILDVLKNG